MGAVNIDRLLTELLEPVASASTEGAQAVEDLKQALRRVVAVAESAQIPPVSTVQLFKVLPHLQRALLGGHG